jgi:hypothetical protein
MGEKARESERKREKGINIERRNKRRKKLEE